MGRPKNTSPKTPANGAPTAVKTIVEEGHKTKSFTKSSISKSLQSKLPRVQKTSKNAVTSLMKIINSDSMNSIKPMKPLPKSSTKQPTKNRAPSTKALGRSHSQPSISVSVPQNGTHLSPVLLPAMGKSHPHSKKNFCMKTVPSIELKVNSNAPDSKCSTVLIRIVPQSSALQLSSPTKTVEGHFMNKKSKNSVNKVQHISTVATTSTAVKHIFTHLVSSKSPTNKQDCEPAPKVSEVPRKSHSPSHNSAKGLQSKSPQEKKSLKPSKAPRVNKNGNVKGAPGFHKVAAKAKLQKKVRVFKKNALERAKSEVKCGKEVKSSAKTKSKKNLSKKISEKKPRVSSPKRESKSKQQSPLSTGHSRRTSPPPAKKPKLISNEENPSQNNKPSEPSASTSPKKPLIQRQASLPGRKPSRVPSLKSIKSVSEEPEKENANEKLPKLEPPVYRKLRCNLYTTVKPPWSMEGQVCACIRSDSSRAKALLTKSYPPTTSRKSLNSGEEKFAASGWRDVDALDCGDACLNRLIYMECLPNVCPCGDLCTNQKIRRQDTKISSLALRYCGPKKGWGVFCKKQNLIREGSYVVEYTGEVISSEEFQSRMVGVYSGLQHHYCLHLDSGLVIDAYDSGSVARFINHSCEPNCEMQKWLVNGCYRMCLYAIRDIQPDEELTYDYNFCSFNNENAQPCQCGGSQCRGVIGSRVPTINQVALQDRGLNYFYGRPLSHRESRFVQENGTFLIRNYLSTRHIRLGGVAISHPNTPQATTSSGSVPMDMFAGEHRQFTNHLATFNSYRSMRTRGATTVDKDDNLSVRVRLGQVLKGLFQELSTANGVVNGNNCLLAEPFFKHPDPNRYWEFYCLVGESFAVSFETVRSRLFLGSYTTIEEFDGDILLMLQNYELYAGTDSLVGEHVQKLRQFYASKKEEYIGLYEVYTETPFESDRRAALLSCEKSPFVLRKLHLQPVLNTPRASAAMIVKALWGLEDEQEEEFSTKSHVLNSRQSSHTKSNYIVKNVDSNKALFCPPLNDIRSSSQGSEVIRCPCGYLDSPDEVMLQCDFCFMWQHADCVNCVIQHALLEVCGSTSSTITSDQESIILSLPCVSTLNSYQCPWCWTPGLPWLKTNYPTLSPFSSSLPMELPLLWEFPDNCRPYRIGKCVAFSSLFDASSGICARIGDFLYFPRSLIPSLNILLPSPQPNDNNSKMSAGKESGVDDNDREKLAPRDLIIVRVLEMWRAANSGEKFIKCDLFLRPYDVPEWCDAYLKKPPLSTKQKTAINKKRCSSASLKRTSSVCQNTCLFRSNEVVYCPSMITLPFLSHRGMCCVLNEEIYSRGRPRTMWTQYHLMQQNDSLRKFNGVLPERNVFLCRKEINADRSSPVPLKDPSSIDFDQKIYCFAPYSVSIHDLSPQYIPTPSDHGMNKNHFTVMDLLQLDGEADAEVRQKFVESKRLPGEILKEQQFKQETQRRRRATHLRSILGRLKHRKFINSGVLLKKNKCQDLLTSPRQRKSVRPVQWNNPNEKTNVSQRQDLSSPHSVHSTVACSFPPAECARRYSEDYCNGMIVNSHEMDKSCPTCSPSSSSYDSESHISHPSQGCSRGSSVVIPVIDDEHFPISQNMLTITMESQNSEKQQNTAASLQPVIYKTELCQLKPLLLTESPDMADEIQKDDIFSDFTCLFTSDAPVNSGEISSSTLFPSLPLTPCGTEAVIRRRNIDVNQVADASLIPPSEELISMTNKQEKCAC